ncbi:MAG TPA: hypothetical protein VLM11_15075, partial [Streptosporangiaceae bacterium]|nr:hypothetical protein [Streptosporangiaceae bacterium]
IDSWRSQLSPLADVTLAMNRPEERPGRVAGPGRACRDGNTEPNWANVADQFSKPAGVDRSDLLDVAGRIGDLGDFNSWARPCASYPRP